MKIFISYGTNDASLVRVVADSIRPHAEVFYWDESKVLGDGAWDTIFDRIDSSDIVLVLITGSVLARGFAVGQEVGRAKAKSKTIIPLVSREIPSSELGFLSGVTYQAFTSSDMSNTLGKVRETVRLKKQEQDMAKQTVFLAGGILALIWLSSQT